MITTPTTRIIREALPDAHITLVGDPYSIGVFDRKDADAFVKVAQGELRSSLRLRRERFDISLDFHNNGRSRLQTVLAGAKRRIGFDKHLIQRLPYNQLVPFPRDVHAVERQTLLLSKLEIAEQRTSLSLNVPFGREHRAEAERLLLDAGIDNEPYAILVATTGSQRPLWQRWPSSAFSRLADRIHDTLGLRTVIPARPVDLPLIEPILAEARSAVVPIVERMDLHTLTAVVSAASLYAGYNTGPMHLAAAHDVPIAAFFEIPHDVVEWYPWTSAPYRMIRPSESCGRPECDGRPCLHTIQPEEVVDAAQEVLTSPSIQRVAAGR